MVVVQAWIVLTTLEAVRLAVCKYVFRQDVRTRAHQSCGIIARFILRTFFDGKFSISEVCTSFLCKN